MRVAPVNSGRPAHPPKSGDDLLQEGTPHPKASDPPLGLGANPETKRVASEPKLSGTSSSRRGKRGAQRTSSANGRHESKARLGATKGAAHVEVGGEEQSHLPGIPPPLACADPKPRRRPRPPAIVRPGSSPRSGDRVELRSKKQERFAYRPWRRSSVRIGTLTKPI